MRFSHFFIERPIFAMVISIVIVIAGLLAYIALPTAQYPEIAPPTVQVTANYPGADPKVIAETVATPIEEQVNGVENMLYMSSQSTADGSMTLTVTFKLGTNLDIAQVLVQNRVAIATPQLPQEVRNLGVTVQKQSPDLMMVVHLLSPKGTYDQAYISNFAFLQIRDPLSRLEGVGNVNVFGAREYSMRIWLNPNRMYARSLTSDDIVSAIQAQNIQVAAGSLGAEPAPPGTELQLTLNTQGRLITPEQFGQIIVKRGDRGEIVYLSDVARTELGRFANVDHERAPIDEPHGVRRRHVRDAARPEAKLVEHHGRQRDEQRPDEVRMSTHELDQLTHEALGSWLQDAQV